MKNWEIVSEIKSPLHQVTFKMKIPEGYLYRTVSEVINKGQPHYLSCMTFVPTSLMEQVLDRTLSPHSQGSDQE